MTPDEYGRHVEHGPPPRTDLAHLAAAARTLFLYGWMGRQINIGFRRGLGDRWRELNRK